MFQQIVLVGGTYYVGYLGLQIHVPSSHTHTHTHTHTIGLFLQRLKKMCATLGGTPTFTQHTIIKNLREFESLRDFEIKRSREIIHVSYICVRVCEEGT